MQRWVGATAAGLTPGPSPLTPSSGGLGAAAPGGDLEGRGPGPASQRRWAGQGAGRGDKGEDDTGIYVCLLLPPPGVPCTALTASHANVLLLHHPPLTRRACPRTPSLIAPPPRALPPPLATTLAASFPSPAPPHPPVQPYAGYKSRPVLAACLLGPMVTLTFPGTTRPVLQSLPRGLPPPPCHQSCAPSWSESTQSGPSSPLASRCALPRCGRGGRGNRRGVGAQIERNGWRADTQKSEVVHSRLGWAVVVLCMGPVRMLLVTCDRLMTSRSVCVHLAAPSIPALPPHHRCWHRACWGAWRAQC